MQRHGRSLSKLARAVILALFWIVLPNSTRAVPESRALPTFTPNELGVSVTHWTVEEGLPGQWVMALAQTPDAFIWCGTSRGLVRFDGVKFTIYDGRNVPILEGVEITELAVDGAGRLWILGGSGEVIVMEKGVFRRLGITNGLTEFAHRPRQDQQGNIWLTGEKAFYCYEDGAFNRVSFKSIRAGDVTDFHVCSNLTAWAVIEESRKLALVGTEQSPTVVVEFDEDCFGQFFRMTDGALGLSSTRGVFRLHEGSWKHLHHIERGMGRDRNMIRENEPACEDPSGNKWIGTYNQGLVVWLQGGRVGTLQLGSDSVSWINALICDAQGSVWVGKRDGLFRLRPTAFRNWAEESGMERSYVYSMAAGPDGTLWFANGWELSRCRPNSPRIERVSLPSTADKTWRVHVTSIGSVWAGDLSGQLFQLEGGEMRPAGIVGEAVTAICDDGNEALWVGTTEGLWQLAGDGFKPVEIPGGVRRNGVRSMTKDAQGLLNIVTGKGIIRRQGDVWQPVPGIPEEEAELIETLYADQDGALWVTLSTHGFARIQNDRWSSFEISTANGLAEFQGIAADGGGYIWLPSNNGLYRIHRSLLTTNASLQAAISDYRQFDRNDGLGSVACTAIAYVTNAAGVGCVWVGTQNGAAVTDLQMLAKRRERSEPPRTFVEAVHWDEHTPIAMFGGDEDRKAKKAAITVPAGVLRLRISYTATQLQFPEKATFQYRLLGLAENWVTAGTERNASFLKLSPGRYEFQVRSANRHGDWNFVPAVVELRVLPAWWQMGWFRAGAGVVGAGCLWLAYAQRMRRLKREQSLQSEFSRQLIQSQELERKRIAAELHDSLGQNLLVAKNLALMGLNQGAADMKTANQLKEISHAVSEALSEARRISKALRPPELDRVGLTKALRGMVQRAGEASGIECRITMEDIDGLLPAAEEINVFRLVQEGMNNIVKHSAASQARVQLLHHPDHLELTIADDGRGFDVEIAREMDSLHSGTGLTGMEERARLAGGEFNITSKAGRGTVIHIRIPVKVPKA